MHWYFEEFKRNFDASYAFPQFVQDAAVLEQWLNTKYWNSGWTWVKKTQARQFCPNRLRTQGRFNAALQHLQATGRIWVGEDPMTGLGKTLVIKRWMLPLGF